ncbi:hypothetical protein CDAR_76781 [Caerostris darwini]|uniref:Uncharacterized protein n=1 Tax=Caerostris darwini TaxID=1538125 RepID=A0AAV4QEZ3_9ARAC|nr:hypothetical protein CDAR_76781 [Caerostris darwini]
MEAPQSLKTNLPCRCLKLSPRFRYESPTTPFTDSDDAPLWTLSSLRVLTTRLNSKDVSEKQELCHAQYQHSVYRYTHGRYTNDGSLFQHLSRFNLRFLNNPPPVFRCSFLKHSRSIVPSLHPSSPITRKGRCPVAITMAP